MGFLMTEFTMDQFVLSHNRTTKNILTENKIIDLRFVLFYWLDVSVINKIQEL